MGYSFGQTEQDTRGLNQAFATATDEQKKFLQELIKNRQNQPSGFPDLGGGILKPAVITGEDRKRMEKNARENFLLEQQLAQSQTPSSTSKYKLKKYVFNQDYEATQRVDEERPVGGNYSIGIRSIPIKYKFKKGDVFEGEQIPVNAGVNPDARKYDIAITTTESINYDGSIRKGLVKFQIDDSIVDEATFLQANRKQLLLLLAVVAGYFAYKKFKK